MIDFDTWWNSAAADEFRAQHEDMDGNAFRPVWDAAIQAAQQQAEPVGDERKAFETWAQSKNMHLAKGNCGWYISAPTHVARLASLRRPVRPVLPAGGRGGGVVLLFRRLQHECLQSGELGHCHAHSG